MNLNLRVNCTKIIEDIETGVISIAGFHEPFKK